MSGVGMVGKNSAGSARIGPAFARSATANPCEPNWNAKRRSRIDAEEVAAADRPCECRFIELQHPSPREPAAELRRSGGALRPDQPMQARLLHGQVRSSCSNPVARLRGRAVSRATNAYAVRATEIVLSHRV